MDYNKHIYNENQYATLFTFDKKVCIVELMTHICESFTRITCA